MSIKIEVRKRYIDYDYNVIDVIYKLPDNYYTEYQFLGVLDNNAENVPIFINSNGCVKEDWYEGEIKEEVGIIAENPRIKIEVGGKYKDTKGEFVEIICEVSRSVHSTPAFVGFYPSENKYQLFLQNGRSFFGDDVANNLVEQWMTLN